MIKKYPLKSWFIMNSEMDLIFENTRNLPEQIKNRFKEGRNPKKLSFFSKIFWSQCLKPSIFQTMNSVRSNNDQRFTPSGGK